MDASGDSGRAEPSEPPLPQRAASSDPTSRRAAIGLTQLLATAVGAGLGNNLTNVFASSRVLLTAVLGSVALIACVLYFLGDIRRGVRRMWHLTHSRVRRPGILERHASPVLSPVDNTPRTGAVQPAADQDAAQPTGTAAASRWRVIAAVAAATALGFLIGYWAIGEAFAHGRPAGTGVVAGFVALAGVVIAWARRRRPAGLSWLRPWRNSVLAVGVAALGLSAGGTLGAADLTRPAQCPPPTELRVLASTEILGPLQAAINAFEQDERTVLHQPCYSVDITAYSADSDQAADNGITGTWNLSKDPRPDIWIPASSEEVPARKPGPHQASVTLVGSIASSPLVVAVPPVLIPKLPAGADGASLATIYREAADAGITFRLPSPNQSEVGRLGIAGLYPSLPSAQLTRLSKLEGYPADSGMLLCQATQARPTVYLVSSAALSASTGSLLSASGCANSPAGTLKAFVPVGASVLDFPFTTLTWGGIPASAAVAAAEQDFYRWLKNPQDGGVVLQGHGLGMPVSVSGAHLPGAATIAAAVQAFDKSEPPARILVAIDDSGPMRSSLGEIEQAVDSVLGPHGQGGSLKAGRDRFGIWIFPGAAAGGSLPATEQALVPVGPDTASQRAKVQRAVTSIKAHDHSAEFDLVSAAAAAGSGADSLVLLTDGDNQSVDPGRHTIATVSRALGYLAGRGEPFNVYIIAFGTGCAETPSGSPTDSLTALAYAGGGSCVDAATGPVALQQQLAKDISALSTGG